jgi:hypothetical protein
VSNLTRYLRIKKKSEDAKERKNRAEGALQGELKRMKENLGCETIEEAEGELHILKIERSRLRKKFERLLNDFETKWEDKL